MLIKTILNTERNILKNEYMYTGTCICKKNHKCAQSNNHTIVKLSK